MRIALQFETPKFLESLRAIAPDAEIVSLSPEAAPHLVGPVDVLLGTPAGGEQLAELLEVCPDVGWIHILSAGVDAYPLDLLKGRVVTCSKGATASPIAEWVMAMMLSCAKRLPESWVDEPPERWFMADLDSLQGKTLGIVGFGEIGQAVAKLALTFGMEVIATVRKQRPSSMPGVELIEGIEELLPQADHLVLALPATAESVGLMNSDTLSSMKRGAHLINVSRGALIDYEALAHALECGQLARVSLDVVEPEPLPAGHWLYRHPLVKLSPHISWNDPFSQDRMFQIFLSNLKSWFAGEQLHGVVDQSIGY